MNTTILQLVANTGCPTRNVQYSGSSYYRSLKAKIFVWTCVLLRTFSKTELFECTTSKLLIRMLRLRIISNTGICCLSDRVVTDYNKCSKIPPSTLMHFATRVKTWRVVRLSASWRSFMQAITSSVLTSSSSRESTFFFYTLFFIKPHKHKSNGVKSGDFGGQLMVLPRPIHLLGKVHSNPCCQRNIL